MVFDQPVRQRRRLGRVLWPLLVVAAVVLAVVVSSAGDSSRAEIEYLESLRTQAGELARDGDALRDVVSRLSAIERIEFETVIETIQEDLAGAAVLAEMEVPSQSLVSVQAVYRLAVASWAEGLHEFASGLLATADNPDSSLVLDTLANGLASLRAGDAFYETLVEEVEREDTPTPLAEMPDVSLSPRTGPLATISALLVSAVRDGGLGFRPGLTLSQLLADPEWEVNPNGQAVVPSTERITFSVVITNRGNVVSEPGVVTLVLTSAGEPVTIEVSFEALDPNQQVTLEFDPLDVSPGGIYQVEATLALTIPDADLTDNTLRVQFRINE